MCFRLPDGMESVGSSKNWHPDEGGAPESWELADLEVSMKNLMAPSKCSPGEHGAEHDIIENLEGDVNIPLEKASAAATTVDEVDGFLREALQNPRDRLTILRLEQEVERFMRSPKQQQLEFQPMPSSYLRLAAHRVAQHYCLQSIVVDSGTTDGSRIVARKNADSRYPTIRLADVPVDIPEEERPVAMSIPKVAIKQRPSQEGRATADGSGGAGGNRLNPSKSVEERKEEYNKARARIFSSELAAKSGDVEVVALNEGRMVECYPVEEVLKVEAKYKADGRSSPVGFINDYSEVRNREYLERETSNKNKLNGGSNSRVAIFRDREKDRKDPDYDRNYDRYSQRFEPGFGTTGGGPFAMQAIYTPSVNYNTEFPQLAGPRLQMHMEPPPPPPIPQQRVQRPPWCSLGRGNMNFRPLDPLMAPLSTGNMGPHSAMALYMHAPQYAYPGPPLTFIHPHDRFQHSLSQPHPQQPDASFDLTRQQ